MAEPLTFVVMIEDGVVRVAKTVHSPGQLMALVLPDVRTPLLAMEQGEHAAYVYGDHRLEVGTSSAGVPTFSSREEADAWLEAHAGDDLSVPGWCLS